MIVEYIITPDYIRDSAASEANSISYRCDYENRNDVRIMAQRIRDALECGLIVSSRNCGSM